MTKYREILRLYNLGISQRSIALTCGCSRNTVKSTIERAQSINLTSVDTLSDEKVRALLFGDTVSNPLYRAPDYDYVHRELAKTGVTLKMLWDEYCEQCRLQRDVPFMYTQFCHYYRQYTYQHGATMRITHKPGEKTEVDWAGDTLIMKDSITGDLIPVYLFVATLPYSQYGFAYPALSQKQGAWVDAHIHMFNFFGGVTRTLTPDNLKTGIKSHQRDEVIVNRIYQEMAEHYGTVVIPTRVRKPKDKASVEMSVNILANWLIGKLRSKTYFALHEIQNDVQESLREYNDKSFQKKEGSRSSIFDQEEKQSLLPLPQYPYEIATWVTALVAPNYHITVDKMHYSVPYTYLRQEVNVRSTPRMIEIFYRDLRIATHLRLQGKTNQYSTTFEHMPPHHQSYVQWTPSKYIDWSNQVGPFTFQVMNSFFESAKVEALALQSAARLSKLGDQYSLARLEKACERALYHFVKPSIKTIQSILASKMDQHALPQRNEGIVAKNEEHGFVRGAEYYGGLQHD